MGLDNKSILIFTLISIIIILVIALIYLRPVAVPYALPKTVWMYWDTVELPPLIQRIRENNLARLNGWKINYLNQTNIANYIAAEEYPKKFDTLISQHKADWIRLTLLSKYGGIWMDAAIIINDINAIDRLYHDSLAINSQFTGFSFKNYETNSQSNKGLSLYVENWFIMAPINSIIIKLWLTQFEGAIHMGFENYRIFLEGKNVDTSKIFDAAKPEDVYLTQHACLQYVMQKQIELPLPPMIILPAENDMLKIRYNCAYDDACTMNTIKDRPDETRGIPYIKLVKGERATGIDISSYFA